MILPDYRAGSRLLKCLTCALSLTLLPALLTGQDTEEKSRQLDRAIREIQSSDGAERRKAAYTLNSLGADALPALPHIIKGLSDTEEQVWFQCVQLVAKIGPDAADAIPALVDNIENPGRRYRNQVWYRASYALGRIGEAAIPAASGMLGNSNSYVRSAVAKALSWMGTTASKMIPELIPLLDDDAADVRQYVAEALGQIGQESISSLVIVLKSGSSDRARIAALSALAGMGAEAAKTREVIAPLVSPTTQTDLRCAAIDALAQFRLPAGELFPLLENVISLDDEKTWEACFAALLLTSDRAASLVPWMETQLKQASDPQKIRVLALTQKLGPKVGSLAPEIVRTRSTTSNPVVAQSAQETLEYIGQAAFMPILLELAPLSIADIPSDGWQLQALRSMGHLVIPDLLQAMQSQFNSVIWVALDVMAARGINDPIAVQRMKELTLNESAGLRAKSLNSLVKLQIPGSQLTPIVQRLMNDPQLAVQSEAIQSIPFLGDSAGRLEPQILAGMDSDKQEIRLASFQAAAYLPSTPGNLVPRLVENISESTEEELAIRLKTLHQLGAKAAAALPILLTLPEPQQPDLAGQWIACISTLAPDHESVRDIATGYLKSPKPYLRLAAFKSLESVTLPLEKKLEFLKSGLLDNELTIRELATDQVAQLGTDAQPLAPTLFERLEVATDQSFAIEALRRIKTTDIEPLIQCLTHKDANVRLFASDYLGTLGKAAESALPSLRKASEQDDYEPVRRSASVSVRRIVRAN